MNSSRLKSVKPDPFGGQHRHWIFAMLNRVRRAQAWNGEYVIYLETRRIVSLMMDDLE
jgi:hypothetical protein